MIFDAFNGSTLGAQWETLHTGSGSHTVAGGALTLTVPNATGQRAAVRQSSVVSLSDGDALVVAVGGAFVQFRSFIVLQQGTDSNPSPAILFGESTLIAATYRMDNGVFALQGLAFPVAGAAWLRLRRTGTSVAVESAPDASGLPGPWTLRHTINDGDGAWTASHAASRAVLIARDNDGAGGTFEVLQVGVPSAPAGSRASALYYSLV